MDVVDETDSGDKGDGYQEPDVLEAKEGRPDPKAKDENDSTASEHYTAVRGTLVRFVDDVKAVRDAEIHQFGCKKQDRYYQIFKPSSHISVYLCCLNRICFYNSILLPYCTPFSLNIIHKCTT